MQAKVTVRGTIGHIHYLKTYCPIVLPVEKHRVLLAINTAFYRELICSFRAVDQTCGKIDFSKRQSLLQNRRSVYKVFLPACLIRI